jgi:hypothetical protein
MIGYNRLGTNGRLGNQMFQYAALRGIAEKNGYDFCIPPEDHPTYADYALFLAFKMEGVKTGIISGDTVEEASYEFDENLFNNCPDNVNLEGFYQTEKYFKHIEEQIRKDFTFKDDILESCKEYMDEYDDISFLHIRRGDNVGREDYYPLPSVEWMGEMVEKHFSDKPILICTDDLEWVQSQNVFNDDKFVVSETRLYYDTAVMIGGGSYDHSLVPYYDLCLMSLCNGGIIANSSLSWWGAWLQTASNKKIVAQDPWYGPKLSFNNTKDLYPESWIVEEIK